MLNLRKLPALVLICSLASLSTGCVVYTGGAKHGSSVSGIMGNINIDPNSEQGNLSMVNGSIHVGHHSQVKRVNTVNGSIEFESNVKVRQAETVNGDIVAGEYLYADGDVTTVNGNIELGAHAVIQGNVTTVNGDINLEYAQVEADLVNVNGDMQLTGATQVKGDVIYRKPSSSWFNSEHKKNPKLFSGPQVSIEGNIILERPVELNLAPGVLKGRVIEKFADK